MAKTTTTQMTLRAALEQICALAPSEDPGPLSGWDAPFGDSEDIGRHHADVARYEIGKIASAALKAAGTTNELRIVFDGTPGPKSPRFVDVEDALGNSINVGAWHARGDGLHELRLADDPASLNLSTAVEG